MDDDSFEIEITDLRGELASATRRWLSRRADDKPPDDESFEIEVRDLRTEPMPAPTQEELAIFPADGEPGTASARRGPSPLAPRARRRARLVGGASAATVLTVAMVVLLLGSPVARGPLHTLFATPTATVPGADTFQLVNDAPWGKLTVDSHSIASVGVGGQSSLFRLDGGVHHLEYVAPPFPTLRCRVSVPAAPSDTCPLAREVSQSLGSTQPVLLEGVRTLDLRATIANLSPEQRTLLIAATQALFASVQQQTSVNTGEHYLAADQSVRVARSALHATQAIELDADLSDGITINGESCVMVCSLPAAADVFGGWALVATVTISWQFRDASGALVDQSLSPVLDAASGAVTPIPLTATWSGTWQVAFANYGDGPLGPSSGADAPAQTMGQVMCNVAQFDAGRQNNPPTDYGSISWCGIAANPADGCVVVNQATNPEDQLVGQPEYLLYRFGVLLAASPVARRLNPHLPAADASEMALARTAAAASEPAQFTSSGGG